MRIVSLKRLGLAAGAAVFGVAAAAIGGVGVANAQPGASCACQLPAGASGAVQSVSGNVFVSQATGAIPARPATRLGAGDAVLVGPQSSSVVAFDGCQLNLGANTTFEVRPQGGSLCLAVNETTTAAPASAGLAAIAVPAGIAIGVAAGLAAISASQDGVEFSLGSGGSVSQ